MASTLPPLAKLGLALLLVCALFLVAGPSLVQAAQTADGVIYVVQAGDRIVDIAARYGVSASAIVRANNLADSDTIFPGQRLVIPTSSRSTPDPGSTSTPAPRATRTPTPEKSSTPATASVTATSTVTTGRSIQSTTYTVQLGDTLAAIARTFGVSTAALQQANNLSNPDTIWVGQKLSIPSASGSVQSPQPTTAPASEEPAPALPSEKIHVVAAGETLSVIASRYGVSVASLVSTNGLGSPDLLRVGMRLIIPGEGSSSGSTSSAPRARATKFVASISQQRCWLYSGETVIARWICSTGRRGAATKPGTFKIQSKMPKAYGSTWNIWMPFWLGIYWAGASENGIHGLPWNADTGVQIWSGNVGTPITYGCVMLDNVNAKMLYDMAYIGMPVVIRP